MFVCMVLLQDHRLVQIWDYTDSSIIRKVCNALSESILNHTRTIKHLRTMVGEYIYGLPRFLLGATGHGIQPTLYRMLKRMDSFILPRANLWDSFSQNHIPRLDLSCYKTCRNNLNYDQAPINRNEGN
jgi:hypothetical protein